jgi:hypothetical protein
MRTDDDLVSSIGLSEAERVLMAVYLEEVVECVLKDRQDTIPVFHLPVWLYH